MHRISSILLISAFLCCGGCWRSVPECSGTEVTQTISDMFRKQLKLTPYLRFVDIAKAKLDLEAIFTVSSNERSASCVAFATYKVKLNDEGRQAEVRDKLLYNLLYELGSDKQIYYSVSVADDGHVHVHVDRVGG